MARKKRRWLRAILYTLLGILALPVLALLIVLYTPWGSRLAVTRGLGAYDGSIPASIELGEVRGILGGTLHLEGLRFVAEHGEPLVEIDRATLQLSPWAAVGMTLAIDRLEVQGLALHLWPNPEPWQSFSSKKPAPPPDPDAPPGPDLPLEIVGTLWISDFNVWKHVEDGPPSSLTRQTTLVADVRAEGREAEVKIANGAGWVGPQHLPLTGLRADVAWNSPLLEVRQLEALTPMAWLTGLRAQLDTEAQTWSANLEASGTTPADASQSALVARLTVLGNGTFEQAYAGISVAAPGLVTTHVDAVVGFEDGLDAALSGVGTLEAEALPDSLRPLDDTPFALLGGATMKDSLEAEVVLLSPDLMVVAHTDPLGSGPQAKLQAVVQVFIPGLEATAEVRLEDWRPTEAAIAVDIASLSRAYAEVPRWVELPASAPADVEGRLQIAGNCTLPASEDPSCAVSLEGWELAALDQSLDKLWINVQGGPQDFLAELEVHRQGDFVRIKTGVSRDGDTTSIALHNLESRIKRQIVELQKPATIVVAPSGITIDDFLVSAARGHIEAEGRVAWEGRSNAVVDVYALDLSLIRQYVPAVAIEGRLDGHLEVEGDASDPRFSASLQGRKLAYGDHRIGSLSLEARYEESMAQAELRWKEDAERIRVFARAPVLVDLETKQFKLLSRRPTMKADIDIAKVSLSRLNPWIGVELQGELGLHVVADGSVTEPRVLTSGAGDRLEIDGLELGELAWQGQWDDKRVDANVQLSGPSIAGLKVSASVPVPLDPQQDQQLAVTIDSVDLSALETWLPELGLAGVIGGTIVAQQENSQLGATVDLLGRDLTFREQVLGGLQIDATWAENQLDTRIVASGPRVRLLDVHAALPVVLEKPFGPVHIPGDGGLEGSVVINDLDLGALSQWTGQVGIGGTLEGKVAVGGTFSQPEAEVHLAARRLAVDGNRVGKIDVDASYRDGRSDLQLRQRKDDASMDLAVSIPVLLDPSAGIAQWKKNEMHRVKVVTKALDRDVLAAVVDLPRDWDPQISADVEVWGQLGGVHGRGSIRTVFGIPDQRDTPVAVMFTLEEGEQKARVLVGDLGPAGLVLDARTDISLDALLDGSFDPKQVSLEAELRSQGFPLKALAPLSPPQVHDPAGELNLRATAKGPLLSPKIAGTIAIDEGAATVVPLNQRFKGVDLHARFDGPDIVLERLALRSGGGEASLQGNVHLARGGTWGEMELSTDKFPIVRPGLPLIRIDSKVDASFDGRDESTVVAVEMREVFVDILDEKLLGNPQKIPSLDDVEMTDREGQKDAEESDKAKKEPWIPQDMQLTLDMTQPILIRGSQTEMMWGGRLEVSRGEGEAVQIEGGFKAQEGYFELLNREFDLTDGSVTMPAEGDIDPYINVTAETAIADYLVSVTISGRATRPELKMSSNPPLPEDQVFALLVTGRPDAGAGEGTDVATKAATLLASFQNSALQRQLRDRIGIDRVGLGFGDSIEEPMLTVGKRINRKLYLETTYHVNADLETENRAEARVEYRFKPPAWSLETLFGTEGIGRVGLWWQRSFGGPKPANHGQPKTAATRSDP